MPLSIPSWLDLLGAAQHSAVHLETRDAYAVDYETGPFADWRAGHRHDPADRAAWWRPWLDLIAATVARGVTVRRARIVSEPVSEYTRFLYDGTFTNVAAGEEVRWLPRRQASDIALPGNDFWLIDGRLIRWNHFTGDGESAGGEMSEDLPKPTIVSRKDSFDYLRLILVAAWPKPLSCAAEQACLSHDCHRSQRGIQ